MIFTAFIMAPLLGTVVHAANDWSKPCLQGECSYDLPASSGASGSLRIWGSMNAISDITPAAGWTILGCDENALSQDIRLVCSADDTTTSGCNHLFQNNGPVGKIVRLPENCGKSAFARIAKSWVDKDQSLPSNLAKRLQRRDGSSPEVQGLSLDTNFADADPQAGDVNIAIQGATVPGASGNLTITPPSTSQRRSRIFPRGVFSFIEDAFDKFNSFDENVVKDLPPVDVDQTFPIFETKVSCPANGNIPAFDASLKADVVTKAHAVVTIGVAASGTIVPPKFTEFGVFAGLNAEFDGSLQLVGSASGTADSGKITLFEVGIPGLDFPGVLSIGPSFKIQGQATATLDIDVDMTVDLSYTVTDAKMFFPSSANHESGGGFVPGNTPLKLSVSPSLASKGTVEAHLIPTIDLGISALDGAAEATVFLDLDSSASATLTLNADANAGVTVDGDTTTSAGASVNGCVDVGTAINVNAGADGSFFDLFDKTTQVNLFTKNFDLFNKCFGASTRRKRAISGGWLARRTRPLRRALACLPTSPDDLIALA